VTAIVSRRGDATVTVSAHTLGDGQDIHIGQVFASTPKSSVMGASSAACGA
jgi:hypothetical protein